jgi:hypothetical protein
LRSFYVFLDNRTNLRAVRCRPSVCKAGNQCSKFRIPYDDDPLCERCTTGYANWFGWCMRCEDDNDGINWGIVAAGVFFTCACSQRTRARS